MRNEIVAMDARWFQAYYAQDTAGMRSLTHDGFRLVDLRPPGARSEPGTPGVRRRIEQTAVDVEGDALVLVARMVEDTPAGGRIVSELSEVWGTDGTGWKMIGMRITPAR